jgi:hypothetical protein
MAILLNLPIDRLNMGQIVLAIMPVKDYLSIDRSVTVNETAERLSAQSPQRAGYLLTLDDALEVSRALFEPIFNEARPRLKHRGLWIKVKWLHGDEFVVVGWTEPERCRPRLGALLLAITSRSGTWSMPPRPLVSIPPS